MMLPLHYCSLDFHWMSCCFDLLFRCILFGWLEFKTIGTVLVARNPIPITLNYDSSLLRSTPPKLSSTFHLRWGNSSHGVYLSSLLLDFSFLGSIDPFGSLLEHPFRSTKIVFHQTSHSSNALNLSSPFPYYSFGMLVSFTPSTFISNALRHSNPSSVPYNLSPYYIGPWVIN